MVNTAVQGATAGPWRWPAAALTCQEASCACLCLSAQATSASERAMQSLAQLVQLRGCCCCCCCWHLDNASRCCLCCQRPCCFVCRCGGRYCLKVTCLQLRMAGGIAKRGDMDMVMCVMQGKHAAGICTSTLNKRLTGLSGHNGSTTRVVPSTHPPSTTCTSC